MNNSQSRSGILEKVGKENEVNPINAPSHTLEAVSRMQHSEDFNEPGNLRGLRRQRMILREAKAARICGKAYQRKGTAEKDRAPEICRGVPFKALTGSDLSCMRGNYLRLVKGPLKNK